VGAAAVTWQVASGEPSPARAGGLWPEGNSKGSQPESALHLGSIKENASHMKRIKGM
jgi:hypothetical protein